MNGAVEYRGEKERFQLGNAGVWDWLLGLYEKNGSQMCMRQKSREIGFFSHLG